jgi:hypothetical protein
MNRFSSSFSPVCCSELRDIQAERKETPRGAGVGVGVGGHTDALCNKLLDVTVKGRQHFMLQ